MSESETIKKEIRELEKQREQAKIKLSASVNAVNQSKQEHENLERELKASTKRFDLLTSQNEALEKQIRDNKSFVEDGKFEVNEISNKLAPLRKERDDLVNEKKGIEIELGEKRAKAEAEADQIVSEANRIRGTAEKKVADMKIDIEAMQSAVDKASRDYRDTVSKEGELSKKIATEKEELNNVLSEAAKQRKEIENKKYEAESLEDRIGELRDNITLLEKDIATLNDLRNTAEHNVAEKKAELEKITAEWDTTKIKLFGISERENQLKQAYIYIKERYKEAGITFTEIEGI